MRDFILASFGVLAFLGAVVLLDRHNLRARDRRRYADMARRAEAHRRWVELQQKREGNR